MVNAIYLSVITVLLVILFFALREEKHSRPKSHYPVEQFWKEGERREFRRVSKTLEINYAPLPGNKGNSGGGKTGKAVSRNISWGGIQILLPEKLKRGTHLSLEIHLNDNRPPIRAVGEVVWMDEAAGTVQPDGTRVFRTGMRFIDFTSSAQDRLVRFLYEDNFPEGGSA